MSPIQAVTEQAGVIDVGRQLHAFVAELYPICRSITGNGVRETLRRVETHLPMMIREVPSGTPAFDWVVPREWNIRDARVVGPDGRVVLELARSNLHVVSYSTPVRARMPLSELLEHVFTLPEHPDWVPYRTSYYAEDW